MKKTKNTFFPFCPVCNQPAAGEPDGIHAGCRNKKKTEKKTVFSPAVISDIAGFFLMAVWTYFVAVKIAGNPHDRPGYVLLVAAVQTIFYVFLYISGVRKGEKGGQK